MIDDSVTKTYRKAAANTNNEIDLEGSEIAERLELADRMEVFAEKEPFITLKDHKANFDTKRDGGDKQAYTRQDQYPNPSRHQIQSVEKYSWSYWMVQASSR